MKRAWIYLTCVSCFIVVCHSYGILTRRMIRTSGGIFDDEVENGGKKYEPVTLIIKEDLDNGESNTVGTSGISARSVQMKNNSTTLNELTTIGNDDDVDDEEDEDQEVDDDEEDEDQEVDDDEESEEDDHSEDNNEDVEYEANLDENQTSPSTAAPSITLPLSTTPQPMNGQTSSTTVTSSPKLVRTRLYPVARLWERTSPDIWSVLSAAVSCLWSGLGMDCFTFRVVPMVKSMITGYSGYSYTAPPSYSDVQPFYLAPRKDEIDNVEGRKRRHNHLLGMLKILKGALAGAIGLKTLLLPVLAGLALVAGKSLFISLASVILSAAAAWVGVKSAADRRVQSGIVPDDHHVQFYMMR